ncbi:MAG: SgcJ/EcaC family oxidoreductase [Acidobacteriota bacterium]|nr:SgcJ/EcaC family oxidoreductase [Acidobacteriota bacterium]MDQ3419354.1 SgcJ/EcaC family oxidoreductase [Acidobacteriota bacterium]
MKSLFGFAVGLILLSPLWPASAQDNAKDIEAIKQIESRWQEAWNSHDMKALASLVAEDVDFIAVAGTWLKGRKAFEEHHATRHAMQFKESVWEATDVEVKFLKSDIALVHVR